MRRVRKEDTVLVMKGKDRGKTGSVRLVIPKDKRVIVTGINMVKRHQRQRSEREPAGIIEKEAPIHISSVKLICRACQKPARVGFRVRSDGVKVRVCRSCGQDVD